MLESCRRIALIRFDLCADDEKLSVMFLQFSDSLLFTLRRPGFELSYIPLNLFHDSLQLSTTAGMNSTLPG